jgi:hypothetical protein
MLAAALIAPSGAAAAPLDGAIWTSLADGSTVNANIYAAKDLVFLNGGPQNCGNSNGLPDGDYYFQVTDPSGTTLLSSDAIELRQVQVANGVIAGVSGAGNHVEGTTGCNGGTPVQLMPYADTPNSGGEYSVDLAPKAEVEACEGFAASSTSLNFIKGCNVSSKNDNFKVGDQSTTTTTSSSTTTSSTSTSSSSTTTTTTSSTTSSTSSTSSTTTTSTSSSTTAAGPTGEVEGVTGTPDRTPPATDLVVAGSSSGPSGDAWRLVLIAMAGVVGALLLLSPAGAARRRRR